MCKVKHSDFTHLGPPNALSPCALTEHSRFTQARKDEEERRQRHNLRRRALKQREIRNSFRQRRLQNFRQEANVTGTAREQPAPPSSHYKPRQYRHEPERKDWSFYKNTGFIWSDLGRTPRNRLPFVVRPTAVQRDKECMERLLWKMEKEEDDGRIQAKLKLNRIASERQRWFERVRITCLLCHRGTYLACISPIQYKQGPDAEEYSSSNNLSSGIVGITTGERVSRNSPITSCRLFVTPCLLR